MWLVSQNILSSQNVDTLVFLLFKSHFELLLTINSFGALVHVTFINIVLIYFCSYPYL